MPYVLVVEDDADQRDLLSRLLKGAGFIVEAAVNGQEALTSVLLRTPDAIVLDLFLPEMDGPELLEVIRSYLRLQFLPVVVLTGLGESPAAERARQLKVQSILVKSKATPQDIVQAVRDALPRMPI